MANGHFGREEKRRKERTDDRAHVIHRLVKPERASRAIARRIGDESVTGGRPHAFADAIDETDGERMPGLLRDSEKGSCEARDSVAEEDEGLTPRYQVRENAGTELEHAGDGVGSALDQAEIRWAGAERLHEKHWQKRKYHLRADVREEARQPEEDNRYGETGASSALHSPMTITG
jgi:hypothetical protein